MILQTRSAIRTAIFRQPLPSNQGWHKLVSEFTGTARSDLAKGRFRRPLATLQTAGSHEGTHLNGPNVPGNGTPVTKLKAVYASRKLDVLSLYSCLQQGRLLEDEYLLLPLPRNDPFVLTSSSFTDSRGQPHNSQHDQSFPRRRTSAQHRAAVAQAGEEKKDESTAPDNDRYCVFFPHGTLVFFNCDEAMQTKCLDLIRPFSKGAMPEHDTEEYEIEVDQAMDAYSDFAPNRLVLKELDNKSVAVIADVLGQAVALRHFEEEIDKMLEYFEKKEAEREAVRILRESNKVLRDVMLTLGLLDQASESSPAWQDERYHRIWNGLRDEFAIEKRWRVLQTKANFLQDNLRFAVELSHARTSERLEVGIIILIAAELLISLMTFAAH